MPAFSRSSSTSSRPSKYSPPRTSETTAARSTFDPEWEKRSARLRIISGGRLSTQKKPTSSNTAIAVDFPAPDSPVMTTRSSSDEAAPARARPSRRARLPRRSVSLIGRETPMYEV